MEPSEITAIDIQRLKKQINKAKLSSQSEKHILNLLTWIVNYGIKNGLCDGIPFKIKKPTVNNEVAEFLTDDQLKSLLIASGSDYVFPGLDGKKRATIQAATGKIHKEAGLPPKFRMLHGLRHHYATTLAASGQVDLYTLQKLLTHKDSRMTQRYAHILMKHMVKTRKSLEAKVKSTDY